MNHHLIIDWGNSRVKAAVFHKDEVVRQESLPEISPEWILDFAPEIHKMPALLCSVTSKSAEVEMWLREHTAWFHKLSHQSPLPIELAYNTPETLGYDRLANAVAARKLAPTSHHALAIDVGTCLKFDFIHVKKGYLGGAISPGMRMRYRSLHTDTHALPLLEEPEQMDLIGTNTEKSMHSGVINGMLAEIDGVIQRYQDEYFPISVFLTGGDAQMFEKALKNGIFANSFLTLAGLNDILEFNRNL